MKISSINVTSDSCTGRVSLNFSYDGHLFTTSMTGRETEKLIAKLTKVHHTLFGFFDGAEYGDRFLLSNNQIATYIAGKNTFVRSCVVMGCPVVLYFTDMGECIDRDLTIVSRYGVEGRIRRMWQSLTAFLRRHISKKSNGE